MSNQKKDIKTDYTFEQALARLESLVKALEAGEGDLDASLSAFEEGISLVRICTEKLDAAEQRVKLLLSDEEGTHVVPFES